MSILGMLIALILLVIVIGAICFIGNLLIWAVAFVWVGMREVYSALNKS